MTASVIRYVRGNTFVKNIQGTGGIAKTCHGLVGELWIGGLCFDAIERMDGYINMTGGSDYSNSTMYWNAHYGSYVINPWLGRAVEKTRKANILFFSPYEKGWATQPFV